MAYSRSPKTARKLEADLSLLLEKQVVSWKTEHGKAHVFAYKVREALWIMARHADQFTRFQAILGHVTVEVLDEQDVVQARVVGPVGEAAVIKGATPEHGMQPAGPPKNLAGATSLPEIIDWFINNQPTNDTLILPHAVLDAGQMDMLRAFLGARTPPWKAEQPKGGPLTLKPAGAP